ncbi:MAG: hypothetical protein KIH08_08545 [Candidatus Freyarchaeota archaeon]|nr:hypothetical protein [Candidatus Jordarchaeia archaeon]MBS7270224.1 hypothetical protein [Candidatus Jordarchaeia archaeon]MBS7280520.1 hypothetical protein [Candidatus Jordarchaeia archaeon]
METQDIVIVLSLVVTAIVIIFVALLAVAGSLQILFNNYIWMIFLLMVDPSVGIIRSLIGAMIFSSLLGPPLSWGASLLGVFNSDWWLKNYMAWYMAFKLGIIAGP